MVVGKLLKGAASPMAGESFGVPSPTWIYHITVVENLSSILDQKGLLSRTALDASCVNYQSIAYENLQERRSRVPVPCGPGRTLNDYVPFQFAGRSPMLYAISQGRVPGYPRGQDGVIHIVSQVKRVLDSELEFVFTDGHAIMSLSEFFDDAEDLERIDWEVMQATWWKDTDEDNDRKRRRQAEFLVRGSLPWSLVEGIGVKDEAMKLRVENILQENGLATPVHASSRWYYIG